MRLFVAIRLPQEVRRGLRDTAASLVGSAPGVSVAAEHALHLTLAFLGEWPEPMAGDFAQALRAACAERYPFWMRLEGIGAFPNPRAPRIVWIGVHAGAELASYTRRSNPHAPRWGTSPNVARSGRTLRSRG